MYSTEFTKHQLTKVQARLDLTLKPSSVEKVLFYIQHLNSLLDPESGQPTRELKKDELQWIEHEKILCTLDFRYFATRYATIRTRDERLVKLQFNTAQRITLDIIGEMEEEGLALHIQDLKARQSGKSTLYEAMISHRVLFYPNVNAIIASSDEKRSTKMAKMVWTIYDYLPWWLLPAYTTNNLNERVFGGHNSGITIQHGAQVTGVARGDTPSVAHLSEIPYWVNPAESIDASLMKAIHDDPNKMVILESTANGIGDWWERSWQLHKRNWPLRRSRFRPIFMPWFVSSDIYPTKTWLKKIPVPANWTPQLETLSHAEAAENYVRENDYLNKYLGKQWTMPTEQRWFWEISREDAKEKRELQQFYQEMPATDTQAFQATGTCPFEPETLEQIEATLKQPWGVFGLVGSNIPTDNIKFCPWTSRDIDLDRKPITIKARWHQGMPGFQWTLLPLKFQGWDNFSWQGKIIIWEPPIAGETYGFGVDTAYGLGKDSSVIQGMRIGTLRRASEQVVEFANDWVSADDLWPYTLALASWYAEAMHTPGRQFQPRLVIECNATGENTQNELRKRGWRHFHDWLRYDHKKLGISPNGRLGWFTLAWSRDMMFSKFIKAIREGWIKLNSPRFVEEMKTLSHQDGRQAMRAEEGFHDDLIMALGICYFSTYVLDVEGPENPNFHQQDEIVYATYSNPQATIEPPLGLGYGGFEGWLN